LTIIKHCSAPACYYVPGLTYGFSILLLGFHIPGANYTAGAGIQLLLSN